MTSNIFFTRSEIKRAVYLSKQKFPECRVGQAFLNEFPEFELPDLDLWEDDDFESVVSKIHRIQGL